MGSDRVTIHTTPGPVRRELYVPTARGARAPRWEQAVVRSAVNGRAEGDAPLVETRQRSARRPKLYTASFRSSRTGSPSATRPVLDSPSQVIVKTPFIPAAACPGTVHLYA
jgi:hypothetical protein